MAEQFLFKKEFRSKTATTRCGYCKVSIKQLIINLLAAGQNTLESMFKRSHDSSETSLETDIVPQPPTKKQLLIDEDGGDDEEAEEINNNPVETEEDGVADESYREDGAGSKVGDNHVVTEMGCLGGDDILTNI